MVLVTTAVVLAVSGGFRTTVGGFRISARSPLATSIAALIAGAWWFFLARRERLIEADLEGAWNAIERHSTRLIGVVALIAAIVAASFATRSAAGADASGYLSQAAMWAQGGISHFETLPIASEADGWLVTPLGWRPSNDCHEPCEGVQVPTYPPGLPLLMSLPHAIAGVHGANTIVIASAAVAVWATAMIAGGIAGLVAAVLVAFSPVFLYQSFQPMSDVPVTAAWLMCFLFLKNGWSAFAGAACALAILIRPNLAPLAIVPFFVAKNRIALTLPVIAAGAFLGFIQWLWYGSPLQSGYGSAEDLFSFVNVVPNVSRYFNWLIATAPVLLLAPLGIVRLKQEAVPRALAVFASLVIISYLVYGVFDQWSYLRFLLPALAVFAIFAAIDLSAWIDRWPPAWRPPIFLALVLAVIAYSLVVARSLDTFKLAGQLQRIGQVAEYVNRTVPEGAVILSGEQSGSMRYYTRRSILRWEAATPETLTSAVALLEQAGRPVYVVLDAWENAPFQQKFAAVRFVALDWPPKLEAGSSHRTRLWQLSDRARFLAGEDLSTIRLP